MKIERLLAILVLLALTLALPALSGCDDIQKPLPKSYAKNPVAAQTAAANVIDFRGKVMPPDKLLEIYAFSVDIRKSMREMIEEFNRLQESGSDEKYLVLSSFRTQHSEWMRMIDIRIEWVEQSVRPDSAVAAPNLILRAMKELRREMYNTLSYMLGQEPYDPTIDEKLLTLFDQANFQLNKPDPRTAKPGVPLDGSTY